MAKSQSINWNVSSGINKNIRQAYRYNQLHEPLLRDVCSPIVKMGFDTFFYTKIFLKTCKAFSLCTNLDWAQYFWTHNILSTNNFTRAVQGALAKKSYKLLNPNISGAHACKMFNIVSNFDFLESGDYIENWGFGSSNPYTNIVEFYVNNEQYFRRFLNYFKNRTRNVILDGEKQKIFCDYSDGVGGFCATAVTF